MARPTPRNHPVILLLTLPLAAALLGCPAASEPADPAASATAEPPALTLDESQLPPMMRFAAADLDPTKDPCVDFGGYVNARWLAANPIPSDRSSWGPGGMLAERSLAVRHQIAEQAATAPGATGIEKIVGDLWATGMDEAAIEAQGLAPLASRLAEIDALADPAGIADYLRTIAARGEGQVFDFGPEADFKNSSMKIGYVTQGGLGLPDRGYYFDADKKDKLDAYHAHVAKVLELSGVAAGDAARQADAVVAFETRLAGASKSREELARDVSLYYNPVTPADADRLTPHFPWSGFFESQGLAVPETFSLSVPAFHQEVDRMIAEEPVDAWKAYLRFHTVDDAAPYLPEAFVREDFEFYGKTMRGQQEIQARWKPWSRTSGPRSRPASRSSTG